MDNKFNLRVYAVVCSPKHEVVLSDEVYSEYAFTKFPGGGLEWGEGTKDCLIREFIEEWGIDVTVGDPFYFTDFFQQSAFRKEDQIISVYYKVDWSRSFELIFANNKEFVGKEGHRFWLQPITELSSNDVTFPIDKKVVEMLKASFLS